MIYLFWLLALPTGLLATLLIVMTLGGQRLSAATPHWLALLAAGAVLGLLVWGYRLGTAGGRPLLAALLVLLSWLLFAAIMLINGLLQQRLWN